MAVFAAEREHLILDHLDLVQHAVNQVSSRYPSHVDRGELWNAGALGLVEAAARFREEAGGHGGVAGITEEQRIPQTWVVGNVDHCVAELAAFIEEYGLTDIVTWAVPPGLRPEDTSPSLERFARDVAPRLRKMFDA